MKPKIALIIAGVCLVGTSAAAQGTGPATAAKGAEIFAAQKCSLCHMVSGKGNKNGPLDGVGAKRSPAELREWIVNPAEMAKKHNSTRKPPMKSYASLAAADVDLLVAYLVTLK
ncbi:MAG: c-type cytochrome [Acidobacteriota bacterium]